MIMGTNRVGSVLYNIIGFQNVSGFTVMSVLSMIVFKRNYNKKEGIPLTVAYNQLTYSINLLHAEQ